MNTHTLMLLAVGAIALSGFVQSVTGFGFGLVSMALLPLLLGFDDAYAVVSVVVLVVCVMTLMGNIRYYRWRQGLSLLISSCLTVPVGFYVMRNVPKEWLLRSLGVLICAYALREVLMSRVRPFKISEKYGSVMGAISGVLSGAFHAGGPPAVIYAYAQDWTKEHIVALLQVIFLTGALIRLVLAKSMIRIDLWQVSLLAMVPLVLAIMFGTRILHRVKRERLRLIVFVFVFVMGMKYLIKGA